MIKDSISYIIPNSLDNGSTDPSSHDMIYHIPQPSVRDSTNFSLNTDSYIHYISKETIDANRRDGIPLPFALEQTDGVFGLILLCFLVFTHVYQGGLSFLKENIRIIVSPRRKQKRHSQPTVKEIWYSYFLVFQTIALTSISLYDVLMQFSPLEANAQTPFITIIAFIFLFFIFIIAKILVYQFVGYIFDFQSEMSRWIKTYLTTIEMLGIFFLIPTLLLIYSDRLHIIGIGFIVILFLISQLILFYRIIVFFIREKFNFLFLIAYLCTIEILPYIFLSIGLIYLYRFDVYSILWLLK